MGAIAVAEPLYGVYFNFPIAALLVPVLRFAYWRGLRQSICLSLVITSLVTSSGWIAAQ